MAGPSGRELAPQLPITKSRASSLPGPPGEGRHRDPIGETQLPPAPLPEAAAREPSLPTTPCNTSGVSPGPRPPPAGLREKERWSEPWGGPGDAGVGSCSTSSEVGKRCGGCRLSLTHQSLGQVHTSLCSHESRGSRSGEPGPGAGGRDWVRVSNACREAWPGTGSGWKNHRPCCSQREQTTLPKIESRP